MTATASPAATRRPEAERHEGRATVVRDAGVVTWRNLKHFTRQPQLLLFSTVQPIIFVLLFAFVFGGAIDVPGGNYINYLLPGIFIQSVAFRSSMTAVGLAEDLERGVIDRFKSLPIARSAVLAGRTAADLIRSVFVVALMVVVGYLIGFRFMAGVAPALAAIGVVAMFGFALSWIFAFVGLTVKGAEAAQSAGFIFLFPMVFASSAFVPTESMPGWLQAFADVSPVTLAVDAARALSLGGPTAGPVLGATAWIVGILIVFIPLSVRAYKRT